LATQSKTTTSLSELTSQYLMAQWYLMYFRFYRWRHVFIPSINHNADDGRRHVCFYFRI